MAQRKYWLGSTDEERRRLTQQHDAWRAVTLDVWQRAGFSTGQTLLDLGSGPGHGSCDLAEIVGPEGRVVALDESHEYIDTLRAHVARTGQTQIDATVGDVDSSDLGTSVFDGIFVRWLFCFLSDWAPVLATVAAALKPGGTLAIIDYTDFLQIDIHPSSQRFNDMFMCVYRSFRDAGGDLDAGNKLPSMLSQHGFTVDSAIRFVRAGRPGSPLWTWVTRFQEAYLPKLVALGYTTEEALDHFAAEWKHKGKRQDSQFFAPPLKLITATKHLDKA